MNENNNVRDVVDAVTGVAKAVPVYQDVVQPAAQELGVALQTLAKTVHIALSPVSALVWGYEQVKDFILDSLAERLQHTPTEDIITPKPNIAGPTIEALRYVGYESSLSELYANLLASSMDKRIANKAHPAFVEIIKQLTSDEAKLITLFIDDKPMPLVSIRWVYKSNNKGLSGGKEILTNFSHLGLIAGCEYPQLTPTYIDNLCRLGLAEIPAFGEYSYPNAYNDLENDPVILETIKSINSNSAVTSETKRKYLKVTELGKNFAYICSKKEQSI